MRKTEFPLKQGSTIGMLGGGQLGRMTALAASKIGFHLHVYDIDRDNPCAQVSKDVTQAAFDDKDRLKAFAEKVDVITYEFENIPLETVEYLDTLKPVFPRPHILRIAQHRIKEKQFLEQIQVQTTPWLPVHSLQDLEEGVAKLKTPCVLKTCRMGYDGKGQILVEDEKNLPYEWEELGTDDAILEQFANFRWEISVIVARDQYQNIKTYAPGHNMHEDHILKETIVPAPLQKSTLDEARKIAEKIAEELNLVGVLGVEFFVMKDESLLVNEIAPRPHNSGHWTIDACECSQFEQLVRAVTGLELGSTENHSRARMVNLIGEDILHAGRIAHEMEQPCFIHNYGKVDIKTGRKMGHITSLISDKKTA